MHFFCEHLSRRLCVTMVIYCRRWTKTSEGGVTSSFISVSLAAILLRSYSHTLFAAWWVTLASFVFVAVNCNALIFKMTLYVTHVSLQSALRSAHACQPVYPCLRFNKRLFKYGKYDYKGKKIKEKLTQSFYFCFIVFIFMLLLATLMSFTFCLYFYLLSFNVGTVK